jgi:hypothetical protein
MSALWKSIFGSRSESEKPSASPKEWLAICVRLTGGEYGSDEEREEIRRFARDLNAEVQVQGVGTYDGDEFGGGEGCLYLFGPNADALFSAIEPLLRSWEPLRGGYATKRYGSRELSERVSF